MRNDGTALENLVSFVEEAMLQQGFELLKNERAYNTEGVQVGEFDLQVQGRVGTTDIRWLIECRDRPSDGPQPGAWIEQLVGRRNRFGFNKVTAVSTTGFARGAIEFAREAGIELREVNAMAPEAFSDWLTMPVIHAQSRRTKLRNVDLFELPPESTDEVLAAVARDLRQVSTNAKILKTSSGTPYSLSEAFSTSMAFLESEWNEVEPNGPSRPVYVHMKYPEGNRYTIEVSAGIFELAGIRYEGDISLVSEDVPLLTASEYRLAEEGGRRISQVAAYAPQLIRGVKTAVELHRLADSGVTHILLRRME